ncbi:hypothetical protein PAMA_014242 [Pampus argenteus]
MANLFNTFDAQTAAGDQRRTDGEKGNGGKSDNILQTELRDRKQRDGRMRASVAAAKTQRAIPATSKICLVSCVKCSAIGGDSRVRPSQHKSCSHLLPVDVESSDKDLDKYVTPAKHKYWSRRSPIAVCVQHECVCVSLTPGLQNVAGA